MNKAKVIEYLQNTFHCNYVEGQGLSLADWGIPEYISVEFYDDAILVDDLSFVPRFSDDKLAQQCMKIVAEVMNRAVRYTKYNEVNHILAFPYNCNFTYITYIRDAIEMNEGEDDYDFYKRKRGVTNSRKSVDSSMQGQEKGIQAIMDEYGCTREEAIDIMNSEVTSGCHGKVKKKAKKEIESSDTEIESSTERNANNLNKIFG